MPEIDLHDVRDSYAPPRAETRRSTGKALSKRIGHADVAFTARVEARTGDGRRRSDVEVILPEGARVAIELQCSEITDAEWFDRHEDYVQAGITDVWLWGPGVDPISPDQPDAAGGAVRVPRQRPGGVAVLD